MKLWLLIKVALVALQVNLMRSILTMLGIIIGVAAVIIMLALGAGAQMEVDQQIQNLGGNVFMIRGSSRRSGGARGAAGSVRTLTYDDALALEKAIPEIEAAGALVSSGAQLVYGNLNWSTSARGIDNRYLTARNWQIESGRKFTNQEISGSGKVVLIGDTIRSELFGESDPLGQTIRVNKVPVLVIGTLKSKGQNTRGDDQDDIIMMPMSTVVKRVSGINRANPKAVHVIMVKVSNELDMDQVEQDMISLLRQRHRIPEGVGDTFRIRNLSELVETRAKTMQIFNGLLAAVASVSLLVGGIGIMNIMLVSVTERTREIGLRMAVGATPEDIMKQFLIEAISLCALGGIIGITIALVSTFITAQITGWPYLIQPNVILLSLFFSAIIGVFFGYYPARKASQLQPIDALRFE